MVDICMHSSYQSEVGVCCGPTSAWWVYTGIYPRLVCSKLPDILKCRQPIKKGEKKTKKNTASINILILIPGNWGNALTGVLGILPVSSLSTCSSSPLAKLFLIKMPWANIPHSFTTKTKRFSWEGTSQSEDVRAENTVSYAPLVTYRLICIICQC